MGYNCVPGGCTNISGCTSIFPGSQTCLTCNAALYDPTPVNNLCLCLVGTLVNNICVNIAGCITPMVMGDGSVGCEFCNSTSLF